MKNTVSTNLAILCIIVGLQNVCGLRCYDLDGGIHECNGVCARITALESGISTEGRYVSAGDEVTACVPGMQTAKCNEDIFRGIRAYGCSCNTDLCNGNGGSGRSDDGRREGGRSDEGRSDDGRRDGGASRDSEGTNAGGRGGNNSEKKEEVNGLRCYDLLGEIQECSGVCARIKALESGTSTEGDYVSEGDEITTCLPDMKTTGCVEKNFLGIHAHGCLCNTDLCNGNGGSESNNSEKKEDGGSTSDFDRILKTLKRPEVIAGIAGGIVLIIIICCVVCCCCRRE